MERTNGQVIEGAADGGKGETHDHPRHRYLATKPPIDGGFVVAVDAKVARGLGWPSTEAMREHRLRARHLPVLRAEIGHSREAGSA